MSATSPQDPTGEDLAAQAQPLPGGASLDVGIDEIVKPPAHLVDDLDNEGTDGASDEGSPVEVAELDFCGDELPFREFPLKYPFMLEGKRVDSIPVRQLTTQQVGDIVREARRQGRMPELFDVYAVMTGHPAKVLRALPSVDGEPIVDCCFDFLPPLLRPGSG